jgi:tetratricopeptide (TPR) repeat protein
MRLIVVSLSLVLLAGCLPVATPMGVPSEPVCHERRRAEDKPWTAPDYIAAGDGSRDRALAEENQVLLSPAPISAQLFSAWTTDMRDATDCYERALRLYPTSYGAHLGLGMVYLIAGLRTIQSQASANAYLPLAKDHLGRAYLLRTDQKDPLFYLGVVATLEGQIAQAQYILGYLRTIEPRNAEALTFAGYATERGGNIKVAQELFTRAYEMGASANTLNYLSARINRNKQQQMENR